MHEKEIRRLAYKQIKAIPGFKRLPRKQKKKVSQEILDNILQDYNFNEPVTGALPVFVTHFDPVSLCP